MSAALPVGPIDEEIRRQLKSPATIAPDFGSKSFGTYENFDACVAANADKQDPKAYCAAIEMAVSGKETPWLDEKPWTGWKFETFIGDEDVVDKQRERVPDTNYVANLPYLVKYGYFEWIHTGQKIGEPIAWRYALNPKTNNIGPQIRVGLIDPDDPTVPPAMKGELSGARVAIEEMAKKGQTSIKGMWAKRKECDGGVCYMVTDYMALWAVGWVANRAANPAADVTRVGVKSEDGKQAPDPATVCGQLWFHGSDVQREAFGSGTDGRGPAEQPPVPWWDDCLAHVGKSSEKELTAFVRSYPRGFRYKAEVLLENGCPPCKVRYDSMIRAGFGHEKALAAVQEAVDAVTGWKEGAPFKTPSSSIQNKVGSMSAEDDAKAKAAADEAAKAAAASAAAAATAGDESRKIELAALQELNKRVEALELAQQSSTPKMVEEALKPLKESVQKILDGEIKSLHAAQVKYDTRLGSLEAFAGRAALGMGQKSYTRPPVDTGPKQGLTQKQLLEIAAGSRNQSEMVRKIRDAAKPGGD